MKNIEKYEKELRKTGTCFALTKEGKPVKCDGFPCRNCAFNVGCVIKRMNWLLEEYKEPIKSILTEKEKIIINNILKAVEPFGAEVQCIAKYRQGDEPTDYYLNFSYKNSNDSFDTFTFNGNELFVGMEVDELYTLEDLGL